MKTPLSEAATSASTSSWQRVLAKYQRPAGWRSGWQLANTLVPYVGLWFLMAWSLSISHWLTFALSVVAAGFLVRIFIIFHDCTHGSFFKSRKANDFWGIVTSIPTFTPFYQWRHDHSVHHATSGDLDRRGTGDIWTLTVQEYLAASRWKRFAYRLARNPFILFGVAPLYVFLIKQRFPNPGDGERERRNVYWTNLVLLTFAIVLSALMGVKAFLWIQFAVVSMAAAGGVWLFYVQHQFEGVYWQRRENWDYVTAAIKGSSFYKLPKVLQWFTGSIGFHHIHHLSPSIPNYNLAQCHAAEPMFQQTTTIGLLASLKSLRFRLWDEQSRKLVGYDRLREIEAAAAGSRD